MILEFIGTRQKPFTTPGAVPEHLYYVDPDAGRLVEMSDEDGEFVLARDPHLWQRTGLVKSPILELPAEPEAPKRKSKGD